MAGLTVGVVALASLFSTCLEVVEKLESYKAFEKDHYALDVSFRATRLRFERWGQAVGFDKEDKLADHYHDALKDPAILSMVREIITVIKDLCAEPGVVVSEGAGDSTVTAHGYKDASPALISLPQMGTIHSKRRKMGWVLGGRMKRVTQVEQFAKLVQNLYDLIPLHTTATERENDASSRNCKTAKASETNICCQFLKCSRSRDSRGPSADCNRFFQDRHGK